MQQRTIAILGFDGVAGLDLTGPSEVFHAAQVAGGVGAYRLILAGVTDQPFTAESGFRFAPETSLERFGAIDTLIIPGGAGIRDTDLPARLAPWLRANAPRIRRIASVCTGIYGLAPSGLLDGRRATTHWRFATDLARRFPAIQLDSDAIHIRDGKFYTSAGVTAGIDLALALVEEDLGRAIALRVARELVVYLKRPGGQAQFSEPLRFQVQSREPIGEVIAWIDGNLDADLSVDRLAERACLCSRQFARVFRQATGSSPGDYVEQRRLAEAQQRLSSGTAPVDAIARSLGYRSPDAFTRAFTRRLGIAPRDYRQRFGAAG